MRGGGGRKHTHGTENIASWFRAWCTLGAILTKEKIIFIIVFFKTGLCSQQRREVVTFFNLSKDFILACGAVPEQSCRAGHCAWLGSGSKLQLQGSYKPNGCKSRALKDEFGPFCCYSNSQMRHSGTLTTLGAQRVEGRTREAWDKRTGDGSWPRGRRGWGESFEEQVTNCGKQHKDIHPTDSSTILDTGLSQELGEEQLGQEWPRQNGQNSSSWQKRRF